MFPKHTSNSNPLSSQTMPDLSHFYRAQQFDHAYLVQFKNQSCLADTLECDLAVPIPSPINTASSPSFSEPSLACLPTPGCSTHDEELEELEYEQSDGQSTICAASTLDESMTDVDDDDDEEDDCSTIAPGESLREPSPSVSLLFEPQPTHSNHLPTLSPENIKLLAESIISFAPALVYTLTRYRAQLELWSQQPSASTAVFRASALVNQAFLRALHILEPVWDRCVRRLMDFETDFQRLDAALDNGTLDSALEAKDPNTLSQLCAMTDSANRIEGSLADLSQQLSEFYDWTDAYLTPALAELNVGPDDPLNATERQEDRRAFQVSGLLDAHSYLCQLMDSLANGVQLCQKSFVELADGCDRLPETLLESSSSAHGQQKVRNWVGACCPPLRSIIDCLSVLASLSDSIKAEGNGMIDAQC